MRTTRRRFVCLMLLGLFAAPLCVPAVQAQWNSPGPDFTSGQIVGVWIAQVTGDVFFPPPFSGLNGPFVRTGRVVISKNGTLTITSIANFGGVVQRESYPGTWSMTREGAFTIVFTNVPIPTFAGIPNVFTFEGFVADNGKIIKIMLSKISLNGADLPNLGTVLWGELVQQ